MANTITTRCPYCGNITNHQYQRNGEVIGCSLCISSSYAAYNNSSSNNNYIDMVSITDNKTVPYDTNFKKKL